MKGEMNEDIAGDLAQAMTKKLHDLIEEKESTNFWNFKKRFKLWMVSVVARELLYPVIIHYAKIRNKNR